MLEDAGRKMLDSPGLCHILHLPFSGQAQLECGPCFGKSHAPRSSRRGALHHRPRGPGIQTGMKSARMSTSPQSLEESGMVSNFQDSLGMGCSQRSVSVWKILKWVLKGTLEIATGLPNRLKLPGTKQGLLYLLLSPPILEPIWSSLQISLHSGIWYPAPDRTEGIMLEIGKTKTIIPLSVER